MMKFATLLSMLALSGCGTIGALFGYVPVDVVDGGVQPTIVPTAIGLEQVTSISGAFALATAVGLNLYRNWTRTRAIIKLSRESGGSGGTV